MYTHHTWSSQSAIIHRGHSTADCANRTFDQWWLSLPGKWQKYAGLSLVQCIEGDWSRILIYISYIYLTQYIWVDAMFHRQIYFIATNKFCVWVYIRRVFKKYVWITYFGYVQLTVQVPRQQYYSYVVNTTPTVWKQPELNTCQLRIVNWCRVTLDFPM